MSATLDERVAELLEHDAAKGMKECDPVHWHSMRMYYAVALVDDLLAERAEMKAKLHKERDDAESFVNEIGSLLGCGDGEGVDDAARRLIAERDRLRAVAITLADFAKTAPGRLPERVTRALSALDAKAGE